MASTGKCPFCGATVRSDERSCPKCGAVNENYVADTARTIFLPKTIDELKEYCAERGMPLLRMRFFIGEDYRHPKAFGIYRDGDQYVVYKNKANGERSIRYQGPDEQYAVGELFAKLLEECHNRGIYPDGKTENETGTKAPASKKHKMLLPIIIFLVCIALSAVIAGFANQNHRNDGYYRFSDDAIYYRYGSSWYYSTADTAWTKTDQVPMDSTDEYYLGKTFNSDWEESDFKQSEAWKKIQESHSSSSSDYDNWDSNSTDWNSDW